MPADHDADSPAAVGHGQGAVRGGLLSSDRQQRLAGLDDEPASADRPQSADPADPADAEGPAAAEDPGAGPRATRRAAPRRSAAASLPGTDVLRKPVNALAIVPQSKRITPLFRKSYNVMLHLAQAQGMDRDVYRAPISAVLAGLDFDSNDTALVKRHLRAMATTAVEWQSPTTGEGASWAISGLIGHAEIKRERGQNWLEWSYSVRLKQELLEPSVFAKLALEVISQLRSHGAIALYEICSRYRDVGRTSRQHWTWWRPVLSGKPETDKQKQLEYRFFKRDVLKTAVAEVNAVTDLDVELLEYKEGRFIAELQFAIRRKAVEPAPRQSPRPLDMTQILRAGRLGVDQAQAEQWQADHGLEALTQALEALERRIASAYPEPLRDPQRYLKALLTRGAAGDAPPAAAAAGARATEPVSPLGPRSATSGRDDRPGRPAGGRGAAALTPFASKSEAEAGPLPGPAPAIAGAPPTAPAQASGSDADGRSGLRGVGQGGPGRGVGADAPGAPAAAGGDPSSSGPSSRGPAGSAGAAPASAAEAQASQRRRHRWIEEWLRRRREALIDEIAAMGDEAQQSLSEALLADMQARNVHPSIRKRLQTSGWQHAMVIHEMVRFYAVGSIGPQWDRPEPADLLDIAAQMGDVA